MHGQYILKWRRKNKMKTYKYKLTILVTTDQEVLPKEWECNTDQESVLSITGGEEDPDITSATIISVEEVKK